MVTAEGAVSSGDEATPTLGTVAVTHGTLHFAGMSCAGCASHGTEAVIEEKRVQNRVSLTHCQYSKSNISQSRQRHIKKNVINPEMPGYSIVSGLQL